MAVSGDWRDLVRKHLAMPSSGWSSGVFGALAEVERDADEAYRQLDDGDLGWVTARGGLRLARAAAPRVLAYEMLSINRERWRHGMVLCLAEGELPLQPAVVTDLGTDADALVDESKGGRLFDMGLGRPGMQFCVRTHDAELTRRLVAACGRSIFDPESGAMAAIKAASPARIVLTPMGRFEVYQRIGSSSLAIPTPNGPHTHVLPKLLAAKRSHDANIPVPSGLVPLVSLYPAHPAQDHHGDPKPFDAAAHAAFQELLAAFGDPAYCAAKQAAERAILSGGPAEPADSEGRAARTAWRIALRQLAAQGRIDGERLASWRERLEPQARDAADVEDDSLLSAAAP